MKRQIFSAQSSNNVVPLARLATFMAFEELAPAARAELYKARELFSAKELAVARLYSRPYSTGRDFAAKFPSVSYAVDELLKKINMHNIKHQWFKKVCQMCLSHPRNYLMERSSFPPFPSVIFLAHDEEAGETVSFPDGFVFDPVFREGDPSVQKEAEFKKHMRFLFEYQLARYMLKVKTKYAVKQKMIHTEECRRSSMR